MFKLQPVKGHPLYIMFVDDLMILMYLSMQIIFEQKVETGILIRVEAFVGCARGSHLIGHLIQKLARRSSCAHVF